MKATIHDIEEADELFVQMLHALRNIDSAGVDASNFNEVRVKTGDVFLLFLPNRYVGCESLRIFNDSKASRAEKGKQLVTA